MVVLSNHLGNIRMTKRLFTALIGHALTGCYGVAGTNAGGFWQNAAEIMPFLKRFKRHEKGVNVKTSDGIIYIDLHITVLYGVNVSSIVESIKHKVTYAVEEQTGMKVGRVNIFVDSLKS